MNVELKAIEESMQAQLKRNEVMANNLANINAIGFKRDVVFLDVLQRQRNPEMRVITQVDFTQGNIRQTDNPLDVALSGKGFIVVERDGEEIYTRNGHFSIDNEGFLVTSSGEKVVGYNGLVNLSVDGEKIGQVSINQRGEIIVDQEYVNRLRIVDFEDYEMLKKTTGNAFVTTPNNPPEDVENPVVLQGRLEDSNVRAVDEMVDMIEVQRQFESSQRIIKAMDRIMNKTVNNVGRFR